MNFIAVMKIGNNYCIVYSAENVIYLENKGWKLVDEKEYIDVISDIEKEKEAWIKDWYDAKKQIEKIQEKVAVYEKYIKLDYNNGLPYLQFYISNSVNCGIEKEEYDILKKGTDNEI